MCNIKCIIVEDEPLAVKVLEAYIADVPFLELTGTFKDALLATEYMRHHRPDLIFLDIHLPRLKGMAFLRTLAQPPAVIVTTAYHQYAVEGFELNITDYLLKPFAFERFLQAVNKVNAATPANMHAEKPGNDASFVFLDVQHKKVKIWFADLVYIESQREYIKVVTSKGTYLTKVGTHEMEAILPGHLFKRVHRSFIIALNKIESYSAESLEVGGVSIPIGRAYKESFEKLSR